MMIPHDERLLAFEAERQLEMTASSTASGEPVKFTRFSADGLRAGQCDVHALIIPPA